MSAVATDTAAKLGHMAGQIADFFKAYAEDEAAHAVADHINQFWTTRMRADFLAACNDGRIVPTPLLRKAIAFVRAPAA